MTPAARVQAAIELIDAIAAGEPAEKVLTGWARASRFAGSKDRAAVRDHVFDVLRMWRSTAALGGQDNGRGRMIGLLRGQGADLEAVFTGQGHAPAPLTPEEARGGCAPTTAEARDLPDWLWPLFCANVETGQAAADAALLRDRAPVDLRVNLLKCDRDAARDRLLSEGIACQPVDLCDTALRVMSGERQVSRSGAYQEGWVDLQDAASQRIVADLPLRRGQRVLDFCAGGGGKSLAVAARTGAEVVAHDADPGRMRDLPRRAERAGACVTPVARPSGMFDLVLCDVPCSGSGSWRRSPDAKWRLTEAGLGDLEQLQAEILVRAATHVRPHGTLAYVTCSLLHRENEAQVARFLANQPGFALQRARSYRLTDGGDGFHVAVLTKTGIPN